MGNPAEENDRTPNRRQSRSLLSVRVKLQTAAKAITFNPWRLDNQPSLPSEGCRRKNRRARAGQDLSGQTRPQEFGGVVQISIEERPLVR